MGYSVSVVFSNSNEAKKMKAFLDSPSSRELFQQMELLLLDGLYPPHDSYVRVKGDLGYPPDDKFLHVLGFNGTGIPKYIWDVCAWMSVQSTHRNEQGEPFILYDDEPMKVTFDLEDTQHTTVDVNGLPKKSEAKNKNYFEMVKRKMGLKMQHKEHSALMNELHTNWTQFELKPSKRKTL